VAAQLAASQESLSSVSKQANDSYLAKSDKSLRDYDSEIDPSGARVAIFPSCDINETLVKELIF
jgi:hypothetical protein